MADDALLKVDGSYGEGGGQILRTALMLSLATGKGFHITNIRMKRPKPGLLHQHLAVVKAFCLATSSKLLGGELGSTELKFYPGRPISKDVKIDIGTAGSITLILGALLPALGLAGGEVHITVKGGTDAKWSPTYDYFENVVMKMYKDRGLKVGSKLDRRGFYPVGGGEVEAEVQPVNATSLKPLVSKPISYRSAVVRSVSSNLPQSVARRQADAAKELLTAEGVHVEDVIVSDEPAASPGTAIAIWFTNSKENAYVGGDAVGERGVRAEEIGKRAADAFLSAYRKSAPLDVHAADMAVALMSLCKESSQIIFPDMTGHIQSNIYTARIFTGRKFVSSRAGLCESLLIE